MRKFITKQFARQGLELLKPSVLLVLYENREVPLTLFEVIVELGIPRVKDTNETELVLGILGYLRNAKDKVFVTVRFLML